MNRVELKEFCKKTIKTYPDLKEEIEDIYELAISEIEDGESESNECYLAQDSINQLVESYKEIDKDTI